MCELLRYKYKINNDYYPYGMLMPHYKVTDNQGNIIEEYGHGSDGEYRYGFQGQEKDDEVKGKGNSINYKYRMHDPRIGRFFAIDPLANKWAYWTPYQFSGNNVIQMVELEGLQGGGSGSGSASVRPRAGNSRYVYPGGTGSTRTWNVGSMNIRRRTRNKFKPTTLVPRREVKVDLHQNRARKLIEALDHLAHDFEPGTFTYKPRVPVPESFKGDFTIVEMEYNSQGSRLQLIDSKELRFSHPEDRELLEKLDADFYGQIAKEVNKRLGEMGFSDNYLEDGRCIPCAEGITYSDGEYKKTENNNPAPADIRKIMYMFVKFEAGRSPTEALIDEIEKNGSRSTQPIKMQVLESGD